MRPAVYAAGVTVAIGARTIVDRCDLTVAQGDWVTIVGPNGAGKSTVLRALAGLVPTQGRVELFGTDVRDLPARERARLVAVVPQNPTVPAAITVAHYVLLGRTAHLGSLARETEKDLDVVDRAITALDLDGLADRRLDTLSGGERQRAVLARGIAQEPKLLLLDEPTTALDIARQQRLLELVDSLRRRLRLTIVSTMHDLTLAAQFTDHLVLLADGRTMLSGAPAQVLTSRELARHYGANVDVIRHRGSLVVIPWRETTPPPSAPDAVVETEGPSPCNR